MMKPGRELGTRKGKMIGDKLWTYWEAYIAGGPNTLNVYKLISKSRMFLKSFMVCMLYNGIILFLWYIINNLLLLLYRFCFLVLPSKKFVNSSWADNYPFTL